MKNIARWFGENIFCLQGIKAGDTVELKCDFSTGAHDFKKGERMLVREVDFFGLELEDPNDKTRWVTDVSPKDVEKVGSL